MSDYTNQELVQALLGRDLTTSELSILQTAIDAVGAYIASQVGGTYGEVDPSTKYFDGRGSSRLNIDAVQNITSVKLVDDDLTENREYELHEEYEAKPLNSTIKTWLALRYECFPCGISNIQVTGEFTLGDTIPSDLQFLATYLLSKLFQSASVGNLKSESIEGYSRTFADFSTSDDQVQLILGSYMKNASSIF